MMLAKLQADRFRLADLEAQILPLERALSVLRAEQTLLRERLESYKYPVLTLPDEITSEIFKHFPSLYPSLVGPSSPTHLTHICRKWREIALAIPALWSAFGFYDHSSSIERQRQISDIWLKRSGSCPLAILIQHYDLCFTSEMFPAIVAHRARWEYLNIQVFKINLTIDGPMPLLRRLNVVVLERSATVLEFHDVPLLRIVFLDRWACTSVTLPWVQVTCLTLTTAQPSQCLRMLQQTANLVRCDLELGAEDDDIVVDPPQREITLPCLEALILTILDCETVKGFLNHFVVPALHRLELEEEFLRPTPIDLLARFISKSGCMLQEVHITGPRRAHEESYLLAFPSIPSFTFYGPYCEPSTWVDSENSGSDSEDVESDSDSE